MRAHLCPICEEELEFPNVSSGVSSTMSGKSHAAAVQLGCRHYMCRACARGNCRGGSVTCPVCWTETNLRSSVVPPSGSRGRSTSNTPAASSPPAPTAPVTLPQSASNVANNGNASRKLTYAQGHDSSADSTALAATARPSNSANGSTSPEQRSKSHSTEHHNRSPSKESTTQVAPAKSILSSRTSGISSDVDHTPEKPAAHAPAPAPYFPPTFNPTTETQGLVTSAPVEEQAPPRSPQDLAKKVEEMRKERLRRDKVEAQERAEARARPKHLPLDKQFGSFSSNNSRNAEFEPVAPGSITSATNSAAKSAASDVQPSISAAAAITQRERFSPPPNQLAQSPPRGSRCEKCELLVANVSSLSFCEMCDIALCPSCDLSHHAGKWKSHERQPMSVVNTARPHALPAQVPPLRSLPRGGLVGTPQSTALSTSSAAGVPIEDISSATAENSVRMPHCTRRGHERHRLELYCLEDCSALCALCSVQDARRLVGKTVLPVGDAVAIVKAKQQEWLQLQERKISNLRQDCLDVDQMIELACGEFAEDQSAAKRGFDEIRRRVDEVEREVLGKLDSHARDALNSLRQHRDLLEQQHDAIAASSSQVADIVDGDHSPSRVLSIRKPDEIVPPPPPPALNRLVARFNYRRLGLHDCVTIGVQSGTGAGSQHVPGMSSRSTSHASAVSSSANVSYGNVTPSGYAAQRSTKTQRPVSSATSRLAYAAVKSNRTASSHRGGTFMDSSGVATGSSNPRSANASGSSVGKPKRSASRSASAEAKPRWSVCTKLDHDSHGLHV